jgi:hypothetical protein
VCYIRSEAQERVGIRHLSIDVYSAAAHLDAEDRSHGIRQRR